MPGPGFTWARSSLGCHFPATTVALALAYLATPERAHAATAAARGLLPDAVHVQAPGGRRPFMKQLGQKPKRKRKRVNVAPLRLLRSTKIDGIFVFGLQHPRCLRTWPSRVTVLGAPGRSLAGARQPAAERTISHHILVGPARAEFSSAFLFVAITKISQSGPKAHHSQNISAGAAEGAT